MWFETTDGILRSILYVVNRKGNELILYDPIRTIYIKLNSVTAESSLNVQSNYKLYADGSWTTGIYNNFINLIIF